MHERFEQIMAHPLAWLWGIVVGGVTFLDAHVVPSFVLWGSAGLVAIGYWQKWRNRKDRGP